VPNRPPLPRVLMWALAGLCGLVAVAGGLALRGPEMVAVGVAGVLAGCMAAGISRETPVGARRRSTPEAAACAGAGTVGVLLVIAGIAALAGGAVAFLTVSGVVVAVLVTRLVRARGTAPSSAVDRTTVVPHPSTLRPVRPHGPADFAGLLPPVVALTTSELGREWTHTSTVLAGPLDAAAREALVARRQEALDELERRDPAGFARWLAAAPTLSSDPAGYVHGGPLRGDPAADTDAA
jgi:hypothetical protein